MTEKYLGSGRRILFSSANFKVIQKITGNMRSIPENGMDFMNTVCYNLMLVGLKPFRYDKTVYTRFPGSLPGSETYKFYFQTKGD